MSILLHLDSAYEAYLNWEPIRDETIKNVKSGELEKAIKNTKGKGAEQVSLIMQDMGELIDFTQNTLEKFYNDAVLTARDAITVFVTIFVTAVIIGVAIALFITRGLTKPINQFIELAQTVARGDLTKNVEIKSKDEIGILAEAFHTMIISLRTIIEKINDVSQSVSATSQQLSAASEESAAASEGYLHKQTY